MKETYCSNEIMERLLQIGAPLTKVFTANRYIPIYYTKPRTDPNWEECDAYYKPTLGAVINWLNKQSYFVAEIFCLGKYGVWVESTTDDKKRYMDRCKYFDSKPKAQEEAIKIALDIYAKEKC